MTTQHTQTQNETPEKKKKQFVIRSNSQSKLIKNKLNFAKISQNFINNQMSSHHTVQIDEPFSKKKQNIQHSLFSDQNIQNNTKIQNLIKKLHTSFIHYKIPQFYAFFFLNRLVYAKQQKIQDSIDNEIRLLKQKSSHYHKIINCLSARQSCLKQLSRCLQNLFNNNEDDQPYRTFRQQIQHYRTLTVMVIKNIKIWKQYLETLSEKNDEQYVTFIYKDEDYLIKLLNDNLFIFNSFLSTYVRFSQKNDPFIIRPFIDAKQSKYSNIFSVTQQQKQEFVYYLHYLAEQRAKYLKKKVTLKEERIKQIQRIYQTKTDIHSSQIFLKKLNFSRKIHEKNQIKQIDFIDKPIIQKISTGKRKEFNEKDQKLKRIKNLFSNPLVSRNKIKSLQKPTETFSSMNQSQNSPNYHTFNSKSSEKRYAVSPSSDYNVSATEFRKQNQKQYDTDFGKMMRQKELQILDEGNKRKTGSLRSLKLKDGLSDRRNLNNKSTLNQLQAIVTNLQNSSPMKLQDFRKKQSSQSKLPEQGNVMNAISPKKLKKINPSENLIKQNEDIIKSMRNQIIKEIQMQKQEKQKIEAIKKIQNQRIQKILQDQIDKQALRHIKQQRKMQLMGKEELAGEFQTKSLFDFQTYQKQIQKSKKLTQLQNELKRQIQLKWLRDVHEDLLRKTEFSEIQLEKMKQQEKLQKQIQKAQRKIQMQKKFQLIQKQERAKIKKQQLQLDQKRKKQIEQEMYRVIQQQKKNLQTYSVLQRIEVEEQMKIQMKESMLNDLKQNKKIYYEQKQKVQNFKVEQIQFRQQVRSKLEKQYKIQQVLQRQKERQQKEKRLQIIKQKFSSLDQPQNNNQKQEKQKRQIQEARESLKSIPSPVVHKRMQQKQKIKLREEFQIQLFAFMKPQKYSKDNENGQFLIKDYRSTIDQPEHLNQKTKKQLQENILEIKKQQNSLQIQDKKAQNLEKSNQLQSQSKVQILLQKSYSIKESDKFQRFSEQKKQAQQLDIKKTVLVKQHSLNYEDQKLRLKLGMNVDEYVIYKKKKDNISSKRDIKQIKHYKQKKHQEFKKTQIPKNIDEYQLFPVVNKDQQGELNKFGYIQQNKSDSYIQNLKTSQNEELQMKISQENNFFSNNKDSLNRNQEIMRLTVHSNLGNTHQNKFMTSDEEQNEKKKIKNTKKKSSKLKRQQQKSSSPKHNQNSENQVLQNYPKKLKKQIMKEKPSKNFVKEKIISQQQLKNFFLDHFENVPRLIKKLNLFKRDQLMKIMLEDHKNVTVLQSIKEEMSIGLVVVAHNQNKKKLRSLNILHIGCYDQQDLLQLLLTTVKFIFSKDPCQEVTMSMFYDTAQVEQHIYVKKFQKLYDPHGVIFQKKIFNTQYQRKHVLRRMIDQFTDIKPKKNNEGELTLGVDLIISEQFLGLQNYHQVSGINVGSFGIMAMYLAKYKKEEMLRSLLSSQKKQITAQIKSLAKLTLDITQNLQKLTKIQDHQYETVFQLNMDLHQHHLKEIQCLQSLQQKNIKIHWRTLNLTIQLPYPFVSIQNKFKQDDDFYKCKYFKFKCNSKNKIYALKSNVYSSQVTILPCKNSKYKIFILDSLQFDQLKVKTSLDIFMKLIFANVSTHKIAQWENIWIPQFQSKNKNYPKEGQSFGVFGELRSQLDYYYESYLKNSIEYDSNHKDLIITPPFILGIMDAQMQLCSEGSPLFIQRINSSKLVDLTLIQKQIDTD